LVNAGVCARETGDLVYAERYFNRALAIRPNLTEALLQLGNIAFDRGDASQARDIVQKYLAVNPATPEVLWLGFRVERKLGDATAAAGFARRVQSEFPNSQQAQMMRSGVDR
jgi:type IV pilus assembly protein PilF